MAALRAQRDAKATRVEKDKQKRRLEEEKNKDKEDEDVSTKPRSLGLIIFEGVGLYLTSNSKLLCQIS